MSDYALARSEIGSFIGTPEESWTPRTADDADSVIRKGIDAVVHNGTHQWSWMRPVFRFQTSDGQRAYTLPVDFEQFISTIAFDGDNYQAITQRPAGRLQQLYSEYNSTGIPVHYALEVQAHDGTTQQQQQLVLHPTPNGTYTLAAIYQVGPIRPLTTDRPYFPGGPENRELFIAACLAQAEVKFLDQKGDKFESFQLALQAAINRDLSRQPRSLGAMGNGSRSRNWFYRNVVTSHSAGDV